MAVSRDILIPMGSNPIAKAQITTNKKVAGTDGRC
jgi:hypothetical protein